MKKLNIFLDSSALIAGVISETGAAHALLQLGERKSLDNLEDVQKEIKKAKIKIVNDPSYDEIQANLYLIDDPDDVPILLAAVKAKVDYLATHDKKHFLNDPKVEERAGIKIGTPRDVLIWIRENLKTE